LKLAVSVGKSELMAGKVSLFVFLIITIFVFSNSTQNLDAQLALAINNFNLGPMLTTFMVISSECGREFFWIPVVVVMFTLGNRDTKYLALELACLFIVGIIVGEAIKFVMYRPRPFVTIGEIIQRVLINIDSSYTSGHAFTVSIGAAFSIARLKRRDIALLLTLEAVVVCYSRVYVGVHYPLDIIAAIFLALPIVVAGLYILEGRLSSLLKSLTALGVRIFGDGTLNL
jgi:membrane-associated phospholipid phosphatase